MTNRVGALVAGAAIFWLVVALPSRWLLGDPAVVYCGVALLLCLVPSALTLLWAGWAFRQSGEQQLLMVLGGSGLRMFLVLGAAWALHSSVPFFQLQPGFWIWVLVSYLFVLGLEVVLLVQSRAVEERHGA